ncbi:MAG TPA: YceI family protein [Terriglobia bacterium]|nr:YceI family protein [Terriglobia bacterium]
MAEWFLEPGHTAAEFCVRHMMVTCVRGHFKNIHGKLLFDPQKLTDARVDVRIDAASLWSGEPERDAHLRSVDFLDAEHHPEIIFASKAVEVIGDHDLILTGPIAIRGVSREVRLKVRYLGQWMTPWWEDGVDKGPKTRAGFLAQTTLNRFDFGVNWNSALADGGFVVGSEIDITIDAEAILERL